MPLVHDRDLNKQIVRVHQALSQSSFQLEQQTLVLDLLAKLILRCAKNLPCLAKLGEERQPVGLADFRMETDSLGEVKVFAGKLWGAQSQRSL